MEVSIVFNYDRCEIRIPVTVERGFIVTPPVAVPTGKWTLYWEIAKEAQGYMHFIPPGITKKHEEEVPNLKLECKCEEIEPHRCPVHIENKVVEQGNVCCLNIAYHSSVPGLRLQHDPTIAVTTDPYGDSGSLHERSEARVVAERV